MGIKRMLESDRQLRDQKLQEGQLWCTIHKDFLPLVRFGKRNADEGNYGYRFSCKECENARRDKERAKVCINNKNRRAKLEAVTLLGGECVRCGYKEFATGLSLHHVNRQEKEYSPASILQLKGAKNPTALTELDKCCLLCLNCHLTYEAKDWTADFIKREGIGWTIKRDVA